MKNFLGEVWIIKNGSFWQRGYVQIINTTLIIAEDKDEAETKMKLYTQEFEKNLRLKGKDKFKLKPIVTEPI